MKTEKFTLSLRFIFSTLFILLTGTIQSQTGIELTGLISENEGTASWNADGTGPEPYGDGHMTYTYYAATRDYVDPGSDYGAHVTSIGEDFPAFTQALATHGYDPGQVTIRFGLSSQGADLQGSDWFVFGAENFLNFYPVDMMIYLDDELMVRGLTNYMVFHHGPSTGFDWICTSNYMPPVDVSGFSSPAVQEAAAAFIQDVANDEIKVTLYAFGESQSFTGNGRSGSYYNIDAVIEKGIPSIPFQGLAANHEGFAGWDANGTGPEPKRNGHGDQLYYIASRDYDDIDPDPDACFARFLGENISGFQNFLLQLEYRGLSPEQVKIKMDIRNLDEDIKNEDWYLQDDIHCVNFYHSLITAEINGELLFGFVCDTAKSHRNVAIPNLGWWGPSATTLVFDASANSSDDVQAVAASLFKDLENRQIKTNIIKATQASGIFNSNGRTGGFWQINEAEMVAVPPKGTQVQPGEVSGHWTMAGHPYIVTGDITIPDGQTLVIDPGVWVKFTDRITFKVDGAIQAIGDSSNTGSVVFTAVNPELGWGHFVFDSTAITNGASVFSHCIFEYGYAPEAVPWSEPTNCGGALAMREYDNVIIENCLFHHNRALNDAYWVASGGAIALWTSSPLIRNCVFRDNSANWSGAIACYLASSPEIVNCLFEGNNSLRAVADGGGAILVSADSNPVLLNNTFVNNHSNFRGGALEIYDGSDPDLVNNIFWGNTAPQNSQIYISSNDCNVDFIYNDIQDGQAGIGPYGIGSGLFEYNLNTDPGFADALALNFQLAEGSPCVDAGIPDVAGLNLPPDDLIGNIRLWDGDGDSVVVIDIGAFEFGSIPLPTKVPEFNIQHSTFNITGYPNPTGGIVDFRLSMADCRWVSLKVYDGQGREVATVLEGKWSGDHVVRWDATGLPAGIYYYRLTTNDQRLTTGTGKMVKY